MKTVIIYQSKYGFTKTYAEWLAEDLHAELMQTDKVKLENLKQFDTIVYGGALYAGGVSGISFFIKNFDQIKDKNLYLFTVGVADVKDKDNIAGIRDNLKQKLSPEMLEKIHIYHLRGGLMYSKMSFTHRMMMKVLVKMLRKKPENELRAEDKIMMDTYGQDVDYTDRSSIAVIVKDITTKV